MSKSGFTWRAFKGALGLLLSGLVLLSVAPSYALTGHDTGHHATTVLFVDAGVQDAKTLTAGVKPDVDVIALRGDADGVQQITAALKHYRNLDSIQILSHGAPGQLALGSSLLSDANLGRYRSALHRWGDVLNAHGAILLYGCDIAQGTVGDRFVNHLGEFAGTAVAASTDATGPQQLGGNWRLEKRTGAIDAALAIGEQAPAGYGHLLALPAAGIQDITDTMANGSLTVTLSPPLVGFTFVNESNYLFLGDPSVNGVYPNVGGTSFQQTTKYRVDADGSNLGSFDLTALAFANYPLCPSEGWNYDFTITGYKLGGGTVQTTFQAIGSGLSFTAGDYSQFTGITGFEVSYTGPYTSGVCGTTAGWGDPSEITFDSFAIANPTAPIAAPTVTGVSPTSGPTTGGTSVTITGTDLSGASSVTFGGTAAASYTVNSATQITATTPPGAVGITNVAVTTLGGTGTGTGVFTYTPVAPTVTGISPNTGPTTGGTAVTITGTSFSGATAVTVGGANCTGAAVVSSTTITCTTSAGTAGAADVAVTTSAGTGTGTGLFTYYTPPTITAINPNGGSIAGGTAVIITGANFTGATSVTIGGVAATGYLVTSDTSITAITPAGTAGAADVAVTTPGGTATGTGLYTYYVAPTVTGISPTSGPTTGGTPVTITGTNFTGAASVTIGGTAVTSYTVTSATSITATTPAGTAGTADVVVTNPGGSGTGAGIFTYYAAPTVTGISPNAGPTGGNTSVTISGTHFTGATSVTIGGTAVASYTVNSPTSITATTPAGTVGAADVAVTTPGGTATAASAYTYYAAPTVTAINPASGTVAGGTPVTITGTNFTGATSVTIGGTAVVSYTVNSATSITATTPAHAAGAADVVVINPGGSGTGAGLYTYIAAPTVTAVTPNGGPAAGGTSVTIAGTNFTGATSVTIGGTAVTSFTVNSATSITATTPAGAAGAADVAVTTPNGTGTGASLFTYYAMPTVTGINPSAGPTGGGTSVTISGTNFTGATAVTISGTAVTSYTVNSATSITATTPAGTAGAADVAVTTPGGTGTGSGLFTYYAAPIVIGVTPYAGPTTGGTSVTITGTNFTGVTGVTIGGTAVTSYAVDSNTQITAVTSAHVAGTADVVVTNPGGSSAGTGLFTYVAAPTVTAVTPNAGPIAGGTAVTISGTDFTGVTSVTIGGIPATGVAVVNSTTITATTPAGTAGAANVMVTATGGTGTGNSLFTYYAAPVVSGISSAWGPSAGGASVTITGSHFTGTSSVTIGGALATGLVVVNDGTITATTPAGTAGSRNVVVTNPGGSGTGTGIYSYVDPPTFTAISPNTGPIGGGTSVVITGSNFAGPTTVTIGGQSATNVIVSSLSTLSATAPANTAGVKSVVVTTPGGSITGTSQYTYVAPPVVAAINPGSGPVAGGTAVTITGTNFTGATSVSIGGTAVTSYTVNSATSITATTPAGAPGAANVVVTTPYGSGTGTGLFSYYGLPTVTVVSPDYGLPAGGTTVTITGTNFGGATSVTIGGVPVTSFTVANATTITATTPAGTHGSKDVVVTTPGGSGTGAGLFTYDNAPTIGGSPGTSVVGYNAYSFTPTANDADGDPLTFSIVNKPSWASFNTATGQLSGTPVNTDVGTTGGIIISVSDGKVTTSLAAFNLTVTENLDIDGDGMPNDWETAHGLNPLDPSDASQDADGDGLTNLQEYLDGTNPRVDDNPPVVTPPANVEVSAVGLFTPVTLGSATAVDAHDGTVAATSNAPAHFSPGTHTVIWSATDAAGNTATATQTVNVVPLVSFSKDQITTLGATVTFRVILNGPAVSYPVTVPYTVSGTALTGAAGQAPADGSVTISSGTEASVSFSTVNDGPGDIVLTMGSPINAVVGSDSTFVVQVVQGNVPPQVSLSADQGAGPTRIIVAGNGPVTITSTVVDPNAGDSHTYDWTATDNVLIDTDTAPNTFTINPSTLSPGVYTVRLSVSDGTASNEATLNLDVLASPPKLSATLDSNGNGTMDAVEGYADSDNDGIPDYLDAIDAENVLQASRGVATQDLLEADPGVHLGLGKVALQSGNSQAAVSVSDVTTYGGVVADTGYSFPGGLFDFTVDRLQSAGPSVSVVLPQQTAIPAKAVYRKVVNGVWQDFVVDGNNHIASAPGEQGYCPLPGDGAYTPGLTEGDWCVQVTIQDGGPNDADGLTNNSVSDPGGVAVPLQQPVTVNVDSSGGGATAPWLLGLLCLLLWRAKPLRREVV